MSAIGRPERSLSDDLWSRVDRRMPSECWPWTGGTTLQGYGLVPTFRGQRRPLAHRVAFQMAHGEVPAGHCVMHTCDNRLCCNPAHLRAGTLNDNNQDMFGKGRHVKGEDHPNAKLQAAAIPAIRADGRDRETIAAAYGVSASRIGQIQRRVAWRHV